MVMAVWFTIWEKNKFEKNLDQLEKEEEMHLHVAKKMPLRLI